MREKKNFCSYIKIGLIFIKSGIKNSTLYFLKNLWYNYYRILKLKGDALMKVELIKEPNDNYSATVQVLTNRGIKPEDIGIYIASTMDNVNKPTAFGEENMKRGAKMLMSHVAANDDILVIVDADCDGFTSAALLINYLSDVFPAFVENHLHWFIHSGKQHGL